MVRLWLVLGLVALVFWVFTIVDCAIQPPSRHRGVSKPLWLVIVIVFPVIGGVLWLVVGRVRASVAGARRAPDDDPEFLSRIGTISDQDERIRRLEEELAMLDAEDDGPAPPTLPGSSSPGTAASGTDPKKRPDGDDDARGQRGAVG